MSTSKRTRIAVATGAAVGLALAGVIGFRTIAPDDRLDASVDDSSRRLAEAVASVEADVAADDVVRLGDAADDAAGRDAEADATAADDLVDTVLGPVVDTARDVGECLLDALPDVVTGTRTDGDAHDATASELCDFLPSGDDFGAIDLGEIDLDAIDLDLGDIDLDDLPALDDVADIDSGFSEVDITGEVFDVVTDLASDVGAFVEDVPEIVGDQLGRWFGD